MGIRELYENSNMHTIGMIMIDICRVGLRYEPFPTLDFAYCIGFSKEVLDCVCDFPVVRCFCGR